MEAFPRKTSILYRVQAGQETNSTLRLNEVGEFSACEHILRKQSEIVSLFGKLILLVICFKR
jgi:hypothetical protein